MGVFEKVRQERQPASESGELTQPQAFAAVILGALGADGRISAEESLRVKAIFASTRLFRQPSHEPAQAVFDRILRLLDSLGAETVMALAAKALSPELREPAFAHAVDLVLADGDASAEERAFVDRLQGLLAIPDEPAMRIVDVMVLKNKV